MPVFLNNHMLPRFRNFENVGRLLYLASLWQMIEIFICRFVTFSDFVPIIENYCGKSLRGV